MKCFRTLSATLFLGFICCAQISAQSNRTEEENREIAYLSNLMEKYKKYPDKEEAIDDFLYKMEYDMPETASGQYCAAMMAGILESYINQLALQNAAANMYNVGVALQKAYSLTEKQIKLNTYKISLCKQAADRGMPEAIQMLQVLANQSGMNNMYKGYNSNSNNHSSSTYNETCSFCNGKGWRAGSSGSTYGLSGQTFCNECNAWVNQSHSHDKCPSCGGKGYRTRTR